MSDERSGVQGVAWFLAGLGVGALIGILYAPKSGRETREDLAQGAREGSEYLRTRGRQAAEQMGQYVDKGREQVNQYVGRGREIVDRGRAQWEDFVERGKNIVNDQSSRVGAAVEAGREACAEAGRADCVGRSARAPGLTRSAPAILVCRMPAFSCVRGGAERV
jgi:gas vesicle protein